MWQGKESKRTFLLPAHFIYLHPPIPILSVCTISPSLPSSLLGFLFGDHKEEGEVAVVILAARLSSGKKAGFSDINEAFGGMVGGAGK